MANNTTLNPGAGGDTIASDDIAGTKHQLVKVEFGAEDVATKVDATNPLPVRIGDGVDQANVTAAGELNVLASAQPGVDVGDVTVNNVGGAGAVNVQDGGNSITVDAPIATPVNAQISDGVRTATVRDTGTSDSLNVAIVDAAGAQITSFGGGVSHIDDAAFTPAVDDVVPIAGVFDDVATDSIDEGDAGVVRMSANRNLYTTIRDAQGNERGAFVTAANELKVLDTPQPSVDIGDVTVNNAAGGGAVNIQDGGNVVSIDDGAASITVDAPVTTPIAVRVSDAAAFYELPPRATDAGAHGAGQAGVRALGSDGTNDQQVSVNATGHVNIADGGNSITVDGAVTVSGTVTANQGVAGAAWEIIGDVAQDAVATAINPLMSGGSHETMADSAPTNRVGTDGDASRLSVTDGALYAIPTGPQMWSYHENSSAALTDTSVHAAPGAGLSLYVTDIKFSTGAATAFNIFFEETTITVLGPWYLEAVAGRGAAITFQTPKKITANTALTVTTSAAIAHSIDVTGFIAPG